MATYNKFQPFVEALAEKQHDLGADQLVIALTNSAPTAGMAQLSEITQIDYTDCSSRNITTSDSSQTAGTYKLTLTDLTLTSSGTVGPFRYVVIYNDTSTNDRLIAWFDYGSSITLANGETLDIDFDGTNGLLQLA
jgi:hypothetical protein